MKFFPGTGLHKGIRKDWLTASLFLWMALFTPVHPRDNPFHPKDTTAADTLAGIRYLYLPGYHPPVFHFDTFSPLIPAISDTLPEEDTALCMSVFLDPAWGLQVFVPHQDTIDRSFLYPHLLKAGEWQTLPARRNPDDWIFVVLVGGFLLFAIVQHQYHRRFLQLFRAFAAGRFLSQLLRGGDLYKERLTYNLFLVFLLVFPLFLYEINAHYGIIPPPGRPLSALLLYFELFALNLGIYILKVSTLRAAGNIFQTSEITSEYILTHFLFSLVQGVILLLVVGVITYARSTWLLNLGILLIVFIYAYQLLRGFVIGMRSKEYPFLYLIIFFFTIEVLPVLLVVKILQRYIS